MKVAIPVWQGRVSPVFDVAGELLVAEVAENVEVGRQQHQLVGSDPWQRAGELAQLKIDWLVCGAISRPLEALIKELGIKVYADVCGDVEEVLKGFLTETLADERYAMPGCRRRRRRRLRRHRGRRPPSHP